MFSRQSPVFAAAVLSVIFPFGAMADADAIAARKAHFQQFNTHLSVLGGMAQGRMPYDAAAARAAAEALDAVAQIDVLPLFPQGSDSESVAGTRALPVIWQDLDQFAERYAALQTAAATMRDAAGTDLDALRAGMGGLAGACGACHQQFRAAQ